MFYMQGTYRLSKPTIAIDRRGDETHCYQVPEGVLVVINGTHRQGRLVEVLYSGRALLMFEQDLLERARPAGALHPMAAHNLDSSVHRDR
jgi:hypothetical protein